MGAGTPGAQRTEVSLLPSPFKRTWGRVGGRGTRKEGKPASSLLLGTGQAFNYFRGLNTSERGEGTSGN